MKSAELIICLVSAMFAVIDPARAQALLSSDRLSDSKAICTWSHLGWAATQLQRQVSYRWGISDESDHFYDRRDPLCHPSHFALALNERQP
jgi:hypothetical protein